MRTKEMALDLMWIAYIDMCACGNLIIFASKEWKSSKSNGKGNKTL